MVNCLLTLTVADQPAQLGQYFLYEELRTCAQPCLGGYNVASQVVYLIGCPPPYYYDSCYWRGVQDLESTVTIFLSSCINSGCSSNPVDLASASHATTTTHIARGNESAILRITRQRRRKKLQQHLGILFPRQHIRRWLSQQRTTDLRRHRVRVRVRVRVRQAGVVAAALVCRCLIRSL